MGLRHLFIAGLVLAAVGGAGLVAQAAQNFGDLNITVDPEPRRMTGSNETRHGYMEFRVTVNNKSPQRDHTVTVYAPYNSRNEQSNVMRRIERTVEVAAGSTVRISLLQPPLPISGSGLGVIIDGQRQRNPLDATTGQHMSQAYGWGGGGGMELAFLTSQGANDNYWRSITHTGSSRYSLASYASEVPVTVWSRQWLGYSRFDEVIVTAGEMDTMPAEAQAAIIRYVEAGGCLVIDGKWEPPADWQRQRGSDMELPTYFRGFGVVYVTMRDKSVSIPSGFGGRFWRSAERTAAPYDHLRDVNGANSAFPVVKELGIPVGGLFVLMLLFAILIGPVNLVFLAKTRRRMWLLWTVPAISLATCLVVVAYAALAEGWRGKARTECLTVLDETSQRASTIGWTAFYAPITPWSGLGFGYDTEVTPHANSGWREGRPRTADWSTHQHMSNGWIIARVPAHFLVRKSDALQRQRLSFTPGSKDDGLSVTNGLGAKITQLLVADDRGAIYIANNVGAGEQAKLKPYTKAPEARGSPEKLRRRVYAGDWLGQVRNLKNSPQEFLQPNTYIAVLDSAPFVEEGLANVKERLAENIVYGFAKEAIHAD